MIRRARTSLRVRLGILIVIPLLPAVGLVAYDAVLLRRAHVAKAVSDAQHLVSLAATFHRRRIEISQVVLADLARDPRVVASTPRVCTNHLAMVLEDYPTLVDLRLVRDDGIVECGALPSPSSEVDVALRSGIVRRAIETREFTVSGFGGGPVAGTSVVFAGLPVPSAHGHARVIVATLSLAWVGEFAGALLPPDATISMVDDDGRLAAAHPQSGLPAGQSVSTSPMHKAISHATADGNVTTEGSDGTTRLFAFTLLHLGVDDDTVANGLSYIAVGMPAARIYGASRAALLRDLGILFAFSCIALAAAWAVSSVTILRPVRQMLHATGRLASGDLSARTGLARGGGEIESLAAAFDEMAGHLEQRQRDAERSAAALEESEVAFRLLAENSQDLIWLLLPDGTLQYVSPSSQVLLGYAPDDLIGHNASEFVHPEDVDRMRADMDQRVARSDAPAHASYRVRSRHGAYRWLEASAHAIVDAGGVVSRVQMTSRDVTERVDAERERERLELQLRQAQKLESIGQLAAGIAHEINTPMQYIGDNLRFLEESFNAVRLVLRQCETILDPTMDSAARADALAHLGRVLDERDVPFIMEEVPSAIAQGLDGVETVSRIVGAMKEFSHPGTEGKRPIDLNHAVQNTLIVATNEWRYVAEVVTDLDDRLPPVPALAGELNQVLLNLIVNAAHAIGDPTNPSHADKGRIGITTRLVNGYAELRISDTGSGIPAEIRSRIFDPFFTTKAVGKGTGQGLAICYAVVVERHGGTITFETVDHVGTTFVVRLPMHSGAEAIDAAPDRPIERVA